MQTKSTRYELFDTIRGITLISMAIYHNIWDMVNIFGMKADWYLGNPGFIWQQSICIVFLFLSGFCISFGKKKYINGVKVFLSGTIISIFSYLFFYEERMLFGVLMFLGTSMILVNFFETWLKRIPKEIGFICSTVLFLITRNINEGELGCYSFSILQLPKSLYHGYIMTFFGFTDNHFFSTDYFSLFPWVFLFLMGFYAYFFWEQLTEKKSLYHFKIPGVTFLGRHTLLLYILHQPVIYGVLQIIYKVHFLK